MMVSLDGYFEGPNHDLNWHNAGHEEFNKFANGQLDEVDTLIFGRATYDMMVSFWPTQSAMKAAPETASRMNALRKVVFSHQPLQAHWEHTDASTDPVASIHALKSQPGKDIAVLGSSKLCVTLLEHDLLDELRLMINPVALGGGTPLFAGLSKARHFTLTSSRQFESGNLLLKYATR